MGAKKIKPCKKFNENNKKEDLSDIEYDRLIKTIKTIKEEADRKLKEISNICTDREYDIK